MTKEQVKELKVIVDRFSENILARVDKFNKEMQDICFEMEELYKNEEGFAVKSSEATEEEILESNRQIQNDKI